VLIRAVLSNKTVREHPIGKIAERTIGYERKHLQVLMTEKGLKAYRKYLNGKDGKILKQKIAKGQWKPIRDVNEVDPQDGYDVISTIDVYTRYCTSCFIKQLQEYEADHGCVVVMETETGKVAIANLGRANDGLIMKQQIMLLQSHEPGSTFKLVDLIILEDK
jgi:cell division protein FtsI (penicillin-binding protein 3)